MTNEEAEKILFYHRSTGNLSPMLNEALDFAISALSKHCASSEQADTKLFNRGYWLMPGEVFVSHNVLNEVLNTIIKSMNTEQRKIDSILAKTSENDEAIRTDDHIADDSKMVDQFRDTTKKTDSERVSLPETEKSNSFSKEPSKDSESEMNCSNVTDIHVGKTDSEMNCDEWWKNYIKSRMSQDDVPDIHVGKTDFQPGDKFILELGAERKMFDEFEIAGTDLYVETRLLEKLKRYEPEERKIMLYRDRVKIAREFEEWAKENNVAYNAEAVVTYLDLKGLINKPEKIPYKKPEIIYCKDCRYRDPEDKKCDHGHGIVWQLPRPDDWFCADGKA